MKKLILLSTIALLFATTGFAQYDNEGTGPARNLSAQLMGSGPWISLVYDQRIRNQSDGLGFYVGFGGYALKNESHYINVPFGINYLLGKNDNYFEIGLGGSYASSSGGLIFMGDNTQKGIYGVVTLAYRYQKSNGLFFKVSANPLFGPDFFWPVWGGLSLGYTFPK